MNAVQVVNAAQWISGDGGRIVGTPQVFPHAENLPVWTQGCGRPFERYPRLDPLSKLAAVLAEWVLENADVPPEAGLVLATRYGCVEADLAYYRTVKAAPELASPQLFPYTLPSAGAAEIAIRHGLQGPTSVLLGEGSAAHAWQQAQRWLETGTVPQCLVVLADAVLDDGAHYLQIPARVEGWSFLLSHGRGLRALRKSEPGTVWKPAELYALLQEQSQA